MPAEIIEERIEARTIVDTTDDGRALVRLLTAAAAWLLNNGGRYTYRGIEMREVGSSTNDDYRAELVLFLEPVRE